MIKYLTILISCILFSGCYGLSLPEATPTTSAEIVDKITETLVSHPNFQLPTQVTFAGETIDLRKRSIYERLDFEFLTAVNHPAQVALWQRRAAMFFPTIERQLQAAGLPDDLKYLAIAESDLRPSIVSPAGALGLWQFMPATARHYGLKVNKKHDQRHLPEPLLGAAIRYFKALYARFGSWPLSMASYNAGEGRIGTAIKRQKTNNYFELDLPRETERYVYRIIAIKIVLENAKQYGFTKRIPASYSPPQYSERTITFNGENWAEAAKKVGLDYKTFRTLNPHLRTQPLSGATVVRLPN